MAEFEVLKKIAQIKIVPLVTIDNIEDAVPLAKALVAGGVPVAEVTFRTPLGGEAIKRIAAEVPECIVGSGTVHDVDHAWETLDNGGKFVITPGFNPKVVEWCLKHDLPVCPGTVTPADLKVVKFFPAGAYGGTKTLKALQGPFADIKFVPTGGVSLENLREYLSLPNVAAAGGSFIPPSNLVKARDWDGIVKLGKDINELIADLK